MSCSPEAPQIYLIIALLQPSAVIWRLSYAVLGIMSVLGPLLGSHRVHLHATATCFSTTESLEAHSQPDLTASLLAHGRIRWKETEEDWR